MEVEVPYFACDKNGRMRLQSLLDYLAEASSAHSDALGVGYKDLISGNFGWVLNRWKLKIFDYPSGRDKIIIETWTSKVYKFYANREFIIYNMAGEEIAKATSVWIFLNVERKRPSRIPEDIQNRYKMVDESIFEDFYKFSDFKDVKDSKNFAIRRSDIDYNDHVNNVKYIEWIIESIPESIFDKYSLVDLEILYKQEIQYGQEAICQMDESNLSNDCIEYLHEISTNDDSRINAYGKTKWKKL